jgi:DNA invertase Pin-like site-specific DNA recombinase
VSVFGYCRVSTDRQAEEGESLGVQERQIQGWCLIQGVDLTETFIERGVSGSIPIAKRPQGSLMMAKARKGDTIVTPRLDRVFRSALDALQTVEAAQKRGIRIVVIDSLGDITGNGMAKAFLTISAAFAELERANTCERVSVVKADQRSRGRYLGGKVPFGFRVGPDGALFRDGEEQAIIQYARDLRRSGMSLRSIKVHVHNEHGRNVSLETINRVTRPEPVA